MLQLEVEPTIICLENHTTIPRLFGLLPVLNLQTHFSHIAVKENFKCCVVVTIGDRLKNISLKTDTNNINMSLLRKF